MGQRNGDQNQRMNLPQPLTLPQRHVTDKARDGNNLIELRNELIAIERNST